MTIEQARECIPDFNAFENEFCNSCVANNWYCPDRCPVLKKALKMDFERILKSYARNDGDLTKVSRFLREAQI